MRRTLLTVAAAALAATALIGCGAVEKAISCATTAAAIAESVNDLQDAVSNAGEDPVAAAEALDRIDDDLDQIADSSGDTDVTAAVDDMRKAVDNVRTSLDDGQVPDVSPVGDAANELTSVCTPN
ncbi:hypothetical protein [Streptomyces sp. JJ38]|uniref:hypothetical protein n=1 Tax=Streptomyces sp. JJ38 TaxID=2738128 RepID=UPI001C56B1E4|nr:hypothetical protein [Streptomyces sp. JJ38]MBW1598446.1 hypothetical protein [Streptomyces sp. JJ38]